MGCEEGSARAPDTRSNATPPGVAKSGAPSFPFGPVPFVFPELLLSFLYAALKSQQN